MLFATAIGDAEQTALLLDSSGTALAGSYIDQRGRDISGEIGSALSGVSTEVSRSMRLLSIGDWTAVVVETDAATIAMNPGTPPKPAKSPARYAITSHANAKRRR